MLKVTSSRRTASLKPGDFDHEIAIVDHDRDRDRDASYEAPSPDLAGMSRISTTAQLLPRDGDGATGESEGELAKSRLGDGEDGTDARPRGRPSYEPQDEAGFPHPAMRPSIEVQAPTPGDFHGEAAHVQPKKPTVERETAIDILYQNERGGFLCGIALFSDAALGGLDATAWTNAYHKPSLTSVYTATVPDPSWEWVWSEWHINHQEGMDEDGWEYSFAFSRKFSWHGPRWWNSFVRRRAWTRKRARKREEDISEDPHMLNTDYFNVRASSSTRTKQSHGSITSSRAPSKIASKTSMSQLSSAEVEEKPDIEDIETLLQTMRAARIDREKLESVENYLDNAIDLSQLEEEMHEIMSLFVFQASRRLLLSRLMHLYDEAVKALEKRESPELSGRKAALEAAVHHADEEVRRLAYWSDIKEMAEAGESKGAVDGSEGWGKRWQGVDQSGPSQPNNGKPPAT